MLTTINTLMHSKYGKKSLLQMRVMAASEIMQITAHDWSVTQSLRICSCITIHSYHKFLQTNIYIKTSPANVAITSQPQLGLQITCK